MNVQSTSLTFILEDPDSEEGSRAVSLFSPLPPPLPSPTIQPSSSSSSIPLSLSSLSQLPVGQKRFIAGGLAGLISKTITAPIETVRLRVVQGQLTAPQAVAQTWERRGITGFYAGNILDIIRSVPSKAIELAIFEYLHRGMKQLVLEKRKRKRKKEEGERERGGGCVMHVVQPSPQLSLDSALALIAGGLAGFTVNLILYPFETLRTRFVVLDTTAAAVHMNTSPINLAMTISKEEGAGAFYRGLGASIVGTVPYTAIRLSCYSALKQAYKTATGKQHIDGQAALVFGAIAGVASASVTFPLEVVRRRMMAGAYQYTSSLNALLTIAGSEGIGALYRGAGLGVIKQAPQYALTFWVYESAMKMMSSSSSKSSRSGEKGE